MAPKRLWRDIRAKEKDDSKKDEKLATQGLELKPKLKRQHEDSSASASKGLSEDLKPSKKIEWHRGIKSRQTSLKDEIPEVSHPSSSSSSTPAYSIEDFRSIVANIFLTNKLSAADVHSVVASGTAAGAQGVEDLAKAGTGGKWKKNLSRDLMTKLLKNSKWPKLYWASIPLKDPKTQEVSSEPFPFLLPHEIMKAIVESNGGSLDGMRAAGASHLLRQVQSFCSTMGIDINTCVPLGLHGDGAPFAAKMRDSLEQFSWNFAASPESGRIPFTAIPKSCTAETTFDAIFEIFSWSMSALLNGAMPVCRHDGSPWCSSDAGTRVQEAGQALGFKGCLIQIRGDWAFYKQAFNVPSWSSEEICWLCRATRSIGSELDFRKCGLDAKWRQKRYGPTEFLAKLRYHGLVSKLFKTPGLTMQAVMIGFMQLI